MRATFFVFLFTASALLSLHAKSSEQIFFGFDDDRGVVVEEGCNARVEDGKLVFADGTRNKNRENRILLDRQFKFPYDTIECTFSFLSTKGAEGFTFSLIPIEDSMREKALKGGLLNGLTGSLTLGFDIYDPPSANWFDEYGNYMDMPQREIYIMLNGKELKRVLSPVEFRDEEEHLCEWTVKAVPGGAEADVKIDSRYVFKNFFIPHYEPFRFMPYISSKTGEITFYGEMDNLKIECRGRTGRLSEKKSIELKKGMEFHGGMRVNRFEAVFPEDTDEWGRILLNITLDSLQGGFDGWDRCGALYVFDSGERIQIARFITPFGTGAEWCIDVSDFRCLLRGRRTFEAEIDTWIEETEPSKQKGWKLSADAELYKCKRELPKEVIPLWSGMYEYGSPGHPIYEEVGTTVKKTGSGGRFILNLFVTGHGQYPASLNAAEFLPIEEKITINGNTISDTLWKDDCYLNPLRTQKGTWKFSRAGWAPGSVVESRKFGFFESDSAEVEYRPQEYTNENSSSAKAYLWIDGSIFVY